MLTRRATLTAAFAAGLTSHMAKAGISEPEAQSISILVGGVSGSRIDNDARAFVPFLERHLPGARISIVNIPGKNGLAALEALARAPADGGTLGWVATPTMPAREVDRGGTQVIKRLRLIGAVQKEPVVFVSPAGNPLKSIQEIIQRAGPDSVPLGTPPAGSPPHLVALRLQLLMGKPLNIVAFPSAEAAREAVLAGNTAASVLTLGDALAGLRDEKLVGLGVTSRDRAETVPDLPPLLESGVPLTSVIRRGLAAPIGVQDAVIRRYAEAMQAIADDPDLAAEGKDSGFSVGWLDGAGWATRAETERADLARLWAATPWLPAGNG